MFQGKKGKKYVYLVCIVGLIIYLLALTCLIIITLLEQIKTDRSITVLIALLIIIPLYISVILMKRTSDRKRMDLTHIVFAILVGLAISLLITVQEEWVPHPVTESSISFKNMTVIVQRTSPLYIPIKSIVQPSAYAKEPIRVTMYNQTPIEPVSVSMSAPANTIFEYEAFRNISKNYGYDPQSRTFVYYTEVGARHNGQVFNSTNEYVINIAYRNMSKPQPNPTGNTIPSKLSAGTIFLPLTNLNITNVTGTVSTNTSNTIDNNPDTRWIANGVGESITFTFDKGYNVSKVSIAFFKGDVRQNYLEINGQLFNSSGKTTGLENFTLRTPLINTRTLQITGNGNSGGGNSLPTYNSFTEVKIYANTPAPVPTKNITAPTNSGIDSKIYHNSVPFQWTIRMTDLSLTTYFWIVMAGVVTSRFMTLILDKSEEHRLHGKRDKDMQEIGWKDGLGILFSFIIALILFSSFREQVSSLTTMILFNISIAFAFGFAFDKTLEVAPRFSRRYRADLAPTDKNGDTDAEVKKAAGINLRRRRVPANSRRHRAPANVGRPALRPHS